jgi:acetyl-CoA carboxylase biotin carboxyl carrier protein
MTDTVQRLVPDSDRRSAGGSVAGSSAGELLAAVEEVALTLLRSGPAPQRIRVRAGDVSLELDWRVPPAPIGTAAHPPASTGGPFIEASAPSGAPADAPAASAAGASSAAVGAGSMSAAESARQHVCAPTVGMFYRSPEPGAPPFVKPGETVRAGQQVGIVEAMKLMVPVEADRAGRVVEVLVPDGSAVEFGQPLIALSDDAA